MNDLYSLKFPIGEFKMPTAVSDEIISNWIDEIASFPAQISEVVTGLSDTELGYIYRPAGWNIRQVVHHCADSHMNALIRVKLTLTESEPAIKPYFEDRWADLTDTVDLPVESSLQILAGVHLRMATLFKSLSKDDLGKFYVHPEYNRNYSLAEVIGVYAWHSNHHLAHIKQALKHKGQF